MFGRGYNLALMGFWLLVFCFVLVRELILPAQVAAQLPGPQDRSQIFLMGTVALAFAIYNFTRWWYLRQRDFPGGVHVNPLAERLPNADAPPPKWEPNPELDFTKTEPEPAEDGTGDERK